MNARSAGTPLDSTGSDKAETGASAAPGTSPAVQKLQNHFNSLDEGALLRVARALEMARAAEQRDPADEQILDSMRPRLRELRPERILTFQRAVCRAVETFLYDGEAAADKRNGALPRLILTPWWRVLNASPHRARLTLLEGEYGSALQEQRWADLDDIASRGAVAAGEVTLTILADAERSCGRRGELAAILGGDRALADMREIGLLLRLHPHLSPAFDRVRRTAGIIAGERITEFTPPIVIAARTAYLNLHDIGSELVEYFFLGLMAMLAQPFHALRLVRVLSNDMSHAAGSSSARLIPARLFSDLTRTLGEIARAAGGVQGAERRVWLMTSARLVSDAALMIKGLAEEIQIEPNPEWQKLLMEARARVLSAVDGFLHAAMQDCLLVLPVREMRDRRGSDVRLEPDMTHAPTEEEVGTASAAALLFSAVKKLMEQEGQDRHLRSKEADLEQRLEIGLKFRVEFLRARPKHPVALAQLAGVYRVLRGLPPLNIIRDLEYRVERVLERHRS
ncbi:hypothetical protein [Niveispirillum irakense]|uniref:hypothetical protein n=1 Tax=Niveispirillum irakense TaxID=34011 RepID=UPI0004089F38|nr:hypothetical protein [Niveispirillum irakense]